MVQESESASKQEFIHGHLFGAVGVLIGTLTKTFCLPLSIQVHNGDKEICGWKREASMSKYLGRDLFRFMARQDDLTITKIIFSKQISVEQEDLDRLVS